MSVPHISVVPIDKQSSSKKQQTQFPIWVCLEITANKTQDQTQYLNKKWLYLTWPVLCRHEQNYKAKVVLNPPHKVKQEGKYIHHKQYLSRTSFMMKMLVISDFKNEMQVRHNEMKDSNTMYSININDRLKTRTKCDGLA